MSTSIIDAFPESVPLIPVPRPQFEAWLSEQSTRRQTWIRGCGFKGEPGSTCFLPADGGAVEAILVGVDGTGDLYGFAALPRALPDGVYRIEARLEGEAASSAALGWALGSYRFRRYKTGSAAAAPSAHGHDVDPASNGEKSARLVWPDGADRAAVERTADAVSLARDLINTPASDLGPAELAAAVQTVAERYKAKCKIVVGDDLLKDNWPAVHAVGRASVRAPRLIDLSWGKKSHPKVTIVGKGVCFDTGGLDIKPSSAMLLMKKDMGGAAIALGLAAMIMDAGLPVRLRLLIPAVENAVSGNAFRPLDVLNTRKGLTVEVGNTDAEGRLILADALAEASTDEPALLVDFATLTGAARVALGADLPALFTNDDGLAEELLAAGKRLNDPCWRLPLHQPYRKLLDSKVADISSTGSGGMAGSITAALFLQAFVGKSIPWAHFDVMAWNASARPGRPEGGEAMTMRAVFAVIEQRFGR